jgi:pimeloyl-ACP methyl ester carboxylesterase
MKTNHRILGSVLGAAAIFSASAQAQPAESNSQPDRVKNVVLVHGAFADGSGWRAVYNELVGKGFRVSVAQNPLSSLENDVASTQRVLDRQDGPTILVGHSYGGTVITQAGVDPKVVGLV